MLILSRINDIKAMTKLTEMLDGYSRCTKSIQLTITSHPIAACWWQIPLLLCAS